MNLSVCHTDALSFERRNISLQKISPTVNLLILVRSISDKSNGDVNFRWVDPFNDWVSKWGLIELELRNRKFTWTNNQENLVMARLDRVFMSTELEVVFPLARVKALVDLGDSLFYGKKDLDLRNGGY